MEFKKFIFNSLRDLYYENVYDVDNDKEKMRTLGFKLDNTKIPDFIINNDEHNVLIELKNIDEHDEDIENRKELNEKHFVYYYEPDLYGIFKRKIKYANTQFKKFIEFNNEYFKKYPITIVLLYCKRFTMLYTIEDAEKFIYGKVIETINPTGENRCEIKNKILNRNVNTSTTCIGVWDGIDNFKIYHNRYCKEIIDIPVFITKNDINLFLLEDSFIDTVRVKKYKKVNSNCIEEIEYLIDNCFINENNLHDYLIDAKKKKKKIKEEQKRILFKKKS